jgi:selenide,water dikinase
MDFDDSHLVIIPYKYVVTVTIGSFLLLYKYPAPFSSSNHKHNKKKLLTTSAIMNMNNKPPPIASDLVLIGGGHSHVHLLKMLGMPKYRQILWQSGIRVTLIAKDIYTPYSGMLPGYVAGHYTYDQIHLDLNKLCRFSGITLIHAACSEIIYHSKQNSNNRGGGGFCQLDDGRPPIRFDCLSIDVGSAPAATDESLKRHPQVIPVKPIANFCQYYEELCRKFQALAETKPTLTHTICVVGGGAGGIELLLSVQYALQRILGPYQNILEMVLVTRGQSLLEQHNPQVKTTFLKVLKERNVKVWFGCEVVGVKDNDHDDDDNVKGGKGQLVLHDRNDNDGLIISFDDCLWCTSAGGAGWLSTHTPFPTTKGFVQVEDTFQVVNHPGCFAAGDCCHNVTHPRPKAGVFAVRAGPPLLENIMAYLTNQLPLIPYIPQSNFLSIISTGNPYAIASKGNYLSLKGSWVWKWKDWIDRKWMARYQELPDLEEMMSNMKFQRTKQVPGNVAQKGGSVLEAFTSNPMRCGGCGAKVGSTSLSRVLKALHRRQVERAKARNLPPPPPIDHDDVAIVPLSTGGGAMIHTIDYFRSLTDDPYVFGKIVAVHALSDVHAMGATAQTALSLAVVPFCADDEIVESILMQMLSGMSDVLQEEQIQLIGGHTCEGTEMACGLAVQGYAEHPKRLLRKRGGRVGDKIVLTKPIGIGALFAADMRAKCKGENMMQAIRSMQLSNGPASQIAMDEANGVRSCTDVTGFGLMGHLLEMVMANDDQDDELPNIGAELKIKDIPFLKGGLEASAQQIFSALQPQNIRNRRAVSNHTEAGEAYPIEYPLLFDPQTAGGLLMFSAPETCDQLVKTLQDKGIEAAVIGEIVSYDVFPKDISSATDDTTTGGVCTVASGGKSIGKRIRIEL